MENRKVDESISSNIKVGQNRGDLITKFILNLY